MSKKIQITLVGAQPEPVYNGIVVFNPDKIVFVCSYETSEIADRVAAEFNYECEKVILDPVNMKDIAYCAETLLKKYANDEVSLNISSGTKTWAYYFTKSFELHENAKIFFIDQNNKLWNFTDKSSANVPNMDIFVRFRLHGNDLKNNYKEFATYTKEDKEVCDKLEQIRKSNVRDFNSLLALLDKKNSNNLRNNREGRFELENSSFVEWIKASAAHNACVKIGILAYGKLKEHRLNSPNAVDLAFNSGWFEYKVATLLNNWDKAKKIYLNCTFPLSDQNNGKIKNETDIIVDAGSKLLFVECKTQINASTDIDKFRSVVKNYGGMGSKALFVTDARMGDLALQKCNEHKILNFSLQNENLNFSPEKSLQLLLNTELFNINTK